MYRQVKDYVKYRRNWCSKTSQRVEDFYCKSFPKIGGKETKQTSIISSGTHWEDLLILLH